MPAITGCSFDVGAEQRAGAEKLIRSQPGDDVGHRQVELIDGELRCVAQRDQRAALFDELTQSLDALIADASRVSPGNGARLHAVDDLARGHFRDQNRVELRAQMTGLHVGVMHHA